MPVLWIQDERHNNKAHLLSYQSPAVQIIAAVTGPSPFPSSFDSLVEQVNYDGSDAARPSTPGQGQNCSDTSFQPADREAAPLAAETPLHIQENYPVKGVFLVSKAVTKINAGLVIGSSWPGPVPEAT